MNKYVKIIRHKLANMGIERTPKEVRALVIVASDSPYMWDHIITARAMATVPQDEFEDVRLLLLPPLFQEE